MWNKTEIKKCQYKYLLKVWGCEVTPLFTMKITCVNLKEILHIVRKLFGLAPALKKTPPVIMNNVLDNDDEV